MLLASLHEYTGLCVIRANFVVYETMRIEAEKNEVLGENRTGSGIAQP